LQNHKKKKKNYNKKEKEKEKNKQLLQVIKTENHPNLNLIMRQFTILSALMFIKIPLSLKIKKGEKKRVS
jgi:hypothetical protein